MQGLRVFLSWCFFVVMNKKKWSRYLKDVQEDHYLRIYLTEEVRASYGI